VKTKRLHEKQPKGHAKHGDHRPGEKLSGPRITETGKCGESERAEICERAQTAHRNLTNLRITAAQYLKTIGRSAANRGFSRQKDDGEIRRFSQPDQRNQRSGAIKDALGARSARCRSCGLILASFHEEGFAFFTAASTRAGSCSGFDSLPGTASLFKKIVGVFFTPIAVPRCWSSSTCC